jgi:hypothetical protein
MAHRTGRTSPAGQRVACGAAARSPVTRPTGRCRRT